MVDTDKNVVIKDIINFDNFLSQSEYIGKTIKFRFNKNWEGYDFVAGYLSSSEDFIPWILSRGSDKKSRNQTNEIQFQFIEVEYHKWLFVGAYLILDRDSETHKNGVRYAKFQRLIEFDQFSEKLVLDWKNRGQSWFYTNRHIIDNMQINSITSESYFKRNIDFPGFENLSLSYDKLKAYI